MRRNDRAADGLSRTDAGLNRRFLRGDQAGMTPDITPPAPHLMPDPSAAAPLRLVALDAEDLEVLSAHLQDFVIRVGDLAFLPRDRRFAYVGNRADRRVDGELRRRRTAGHFDRVTRVATRGIDRAAPETVLNLLAVTFAPGEEPSGAIELHFSGGATVRLEVECIEAQVADLGPVWAARAEPAHDRRDG